MKLIEIASLSGASHMLDKRLAETEPAGFALDSRAIKAGELFVAIPGERVDGHQFVREVFEKGACAAMVRCGNFLGKSKGSPHQAAQRWMSRPT